VLLIAGNAWAMPAGTPTATPTATPTSTPTSTPTATPGGTTAVGVMLITMRDNLKAQWRIIQCYPDVCEEEQ
jgi:hypothetical protein